VDSSILEKRDKLLKELLPGLLLLFGDAYKENDDVTLEDILAMDNATWEEDKPI
jgi:hypothetical protein